MYFRLYCRTCNKNTSRREIGGMCNFCGNRLSRESNKEKKLNKAKSEVIQLELEDNELIKR